MRKWFGVFFMVVVVSGFLAMPGVASVNAGAGGVAIKGFDPVAYFESGAAVQGSDAFQAEWAGAVWQFESRAHLELFKSNPERYAPQYGGYCAYAVSQGSKAPIDPNAWTIHNGKLYLNYNLAVRQKWEQDKKRYIDLADSKWPGLNR